MWRILARRALLNTPSTSTNLHSQVTTLLDFLISEPRLHFYQNPRFFSTSDPKTTTSTGPGFSELNQLGNITKLEELNKDSTFTDIVEDFGEVGNEGVDGVVESDVNHVVENLLSLLKSSVPEERSLKSNLKGMCGLVLDGDDLFFKVLETPSIPISNLIVFFRWGLQKLDCRVSSRVLDVLAEVIYHGENPGHVYALWDFVKMVGGKEKGGVSVECLNKLIAKYSVMITRKAPRGVVGMFEEAAFEVFSKFEELGCHPNADSYYFTIEALCKRSLFERAWSLCEKMMELDQLPENADRVGNIISFLCEGGRPRDAHLVYAYAKGKKICPPRSSMESLVTSLCKMERTDEKLDKEIAALALRILDDCPAQDRKDFSERPFLRVVEKLCSIGDVGRAKKLLHQMMESGPPPGNATFNFVINGLKKHGDMDEALKVMRLMEGRGLKPDGFTYSVVVTGYVRDGSIEEACTIFDEAKQKHQKLSKSTYNSLIRGLCKNGQHDKAVSLFGEMKQQGLKLNHDDYNVLIKSLCFKALDWRTAEKLREDMQSNGLTLMDKTSTLIDEVKKLDEGFVMQHDSESSIHLDEGYVIQDDLH